MGMDHYDEDIKGLIPHIVAAMNSRIGRTELCAEEPMNARIIDTEQGGVLVSEINLKVPAEGHGLGLWGREKGRVARECDNNELVHT